MNDNLINLIMCSYIYIVSYASYYLSLSYNICLFAKKYIYFILMTICNNSNGVRPPTLCNEC